MFELKELERQLHNLLRLGTIAVVDHSKRLVKVQSGDLLTGWLDWPAEMGRNYRRWRPLRLGTQVLIASPSGDPAQAQIIGTLYTDAFPSPSTDPELDLVEFDDGSKVEYHIGKQQMQVYSAGDLSLHSAGNLYLRADKEIWIDSQHLHVFEEGSL